MLDLNSYAWCYQRGETCMEERRYEIFPGSIEDMSLDPAYRYCISSCLCFMLNYLLSVAVVVAMWLSLLILCWSWSKRSKIPLFSFSERKGYAAFKLCLENALSLSVSQSVCLPNPIRLQEIKKREYVLSRSFKSWRMENRGQWTGIRDPFYRRTQGRGW
jgi:hypothetical protein